MIFKKAIKEQHTTPTETNWIFCNDRMPEPDECFCGCLVIVRWDKGGLSVEKASWDCVNEKFENVLVDSPEKIECVIAWMELPKIPNDLFCTVHDFSYLTGLE